MGRTLHYSITKTDRSNFTEKEISAMRQVTNKYNQEPAFWTCETLCIEPMQYFPNWKVIASWDAMSAEIAALEANGINHDKALLLLEKQGKLRFFRENWRKEFNGFTKVQGNELNSLAVFSGLVELSRLAPKLLIELSDEGEFLYCDLKIQAGKVLPDLKGLLDSIEGWQAALFQVSQHKLAKEFRERVKRLGGLGPDLDKTYYKKTAQRHLLFQLELLELAYQKITKAWDQKSQLNLYNLSHLDSSRWFYPDDWHRPVDVEKFKDYEGGAKNLMDGFKGEGFGLAPSAEGESLRQLAMFQKLFGKENLQVLPKI